MGGLSEGGGFGTRRRGGAEVGRGGKELESQKLKGGGSGDMGGAGAAEDGSEVGIFEWEQRAWVSQPRALRGCVSALWAGFLWRKPGMPAAAGRAQGVAEARVAGPRFRQEVPGQIEAVRQRG